MRDRTGNDCKDGLLRRIGAALLLGKRHGRQRLALPIHANNRTVGQLVHRSVNKAVPNLLRLSRQCKGPFEAVT